ncbi:MAG: hypothetical protein H6907_10070 [Hyphomicrobiales bacterium]|nr:hypothetical protein [Hyphomicrobiales bacterium]MCP5372064.1 hypothetical protein [Hyphomicrobiales bacterium]
MRLERKQAERRVHFLGLARIGVKNFLHSHTRALRDIAAKRPTVSPFAL